MKTTALKNIRKSRNLTLHDLWLKINKEINLTRLSDINIAREVITNDEITILNKYLELTPEEIEDLEDMEVDIFLKEHAEKINNLMALVPKDLKAGESIETICPNCGSRLRIAKASINGHLWITCEKEGVLICQ